VPRRPAATLESIEIMSSETVPERTGRPKKFLLHMARIGDEWAGTAICINKDERIRFATINELLEWLDRFEGDSPPACSAADTERDEE
jgi:hypothetical protein